MHENYWAAVSDWYDEQLTWLWNNHLALFWAWCENNSQEQVIINTVMKHIFRTLVINQGEDSVLITWLYMLQTNYGWNWIFFFFLMGSIETVERISAALVRCSKAMMQVNWIRTHVHYHTNHNTNYSWMLSIHFIMIINIVVGNKVPHKHYTLQA